MNIHWFIAAQRPASIEPDADAGQSWGDQPSPMTPVSGQPCHQRGDMSAEAQPGTSGKAPDKRCQKFTTTFDQTSLQS